MSRLICALIFCTTAMLLGCGSGDVPSPAGSLPPESAAIPPSPIRHIVIIMQENRTIDNLFNGFPGVDSVLTGNHRGKIVPLVPVSLGDPRDLSHSHSEFWKNWDYGKLDGFDSAGYAYVPREQIAPYWTLATNFTIGDRMFQSNNGPSFPAHQYMIAGQAGNADENPDENVWGCDAAPTARVALIGPNGTDLPGVYPCFDYSTMADLLDARHISWRYYAPGTTDGFFIISAFQAIRHIRFGNDWATKVVSPQTRVLTDIANGHLAQVTWIVPDFDHSDHPGSKSTEGPDWVASITNAIGDSRFWDSTVIFITWDDWGGWYDHVLPPQVDAMGLGFRVPVLVVSPYAKHGYVSHVTHESSGFLTFIESNFGLPNLGSRDALADGFADCFDYTQSPKPYTHIRTKRTPEELIREKPTGPPDDD